MIDLTFVQVTEKRLYLTCYYCQDDRKIIKSFKLNSFGGSLWI